MLALVSNCWRSQQWANMTGHDNQSAWLGVKIYHLWGSFVHDGPMNKLPIICRDTSTREILSVYAMSSVWWNESYCSAFLVLFAFCLHVHHGCITSYNLQFSLLTLERSCLCGLDLEPALMRRKMQCHMLMWVSLLSLSSSSPLFFPLSFPLFFLPSLQDVLF